LMAVFGFPTIAVGAVPDLPRGTRDAEIATWCGANGAVWITLDRGILKDREIVRAILDSKTSLLLLPARGMRSRDYLELLVCRFRRFEDALQNARARRRPLRARVRKAGSVVEITVGPLRA